MSWKIVEVNMLGEEETFEDGFDTEQEAIDGYYELLDDGYPESGTNLAVEPDD